MQADPTLRPNSVRVIDCIEFLLKQIKPANSDETRAYYTDGVAVDRKRDPRKLTQDLAAEFKNCGALIRIKEGDGQTQSKTGLVGNARRTLAKIDLICCSFLSDQQDRAGIYSDQVTGWLRHDIETALSYDENGRSPIIRAAVGLSQEKGPWGDPGMWGSSPYCLNLSFCGWLAGGVANFPYFMQICHLQYIDDRYGPGLLPGNPP